MATILEFAVWGLLGLLLLGVLGALIWWFLRAESSKIEPRDSASQDPIAESDRLDQLPIAVEKSNRNLLETARMWEKAGDLGQAIVYLFAYMLVELDRHQLVRLTRGKTNRQYLAELERSFSGSVRPVAALQEQSKSARGRIGDRPGDEFSLSQAITTASPSSLVLIVRRTMTAFEDVFFGHHQISEQRFSKCWNSLDMFREQLEQMV